MKVIKRDGIIVNFYTKKFINALITSVIANKIPLKNIYIKKL